MMRSDGDSVAGDDWRIEGAAEIAAIAQGGWIMTKHKRDSLTLGDLIRIVSRFSNNDHEVGVAVSDLLQRGVVRLAGQRSQHRPGKNGR